MSDLNARKASPASGESGTAPASPTSRWVRFWCGVMGWHPHHARVTTGFDGASLHQRCRRCGYVGLVDSTGSLF